MILLVFLSAKEMYTGGVGQMIDSKNGAFIRARLLEEWKEKKSFFLWKKTYASVREKQNDRLL